jgi:hypothetical protein
VAQEGEAAGEHAADQPGIIASGGAVAGAAEYRIADSLEGSIMSRLLLACAVVLASLLLSVSPSPAAQPGENNSNGGGGGGGGGHENLLLRAQAATTIYDLDLREDQLHALQKLATNTAGKPDGQPPRLGPKLRPLVAELCTALAKADDDKVSDLEDKVDEMKDQANIDEPYVPATEAAKAKAADVSKLLTAAQVANFISMNSDDIAGPSETLIDAMDDARGGSDSDFDDVKSDTADEVVMLARGNEKDAKLADSVGTFLTKVRKMSDADYKAKRAELEGEAHKLVGTIDPFVSLRHWCESEFADLLSNPELPGAIRARLDHIKDAPAAPTASANGGSKEGK